VSLPNSLVEPLGRALREHGLGRRVERVREVAGGCISHGALLETDSGASLFLKWNATAPPGMFDAEADGLLALAAQGAIRVPAPIAWRDAAVVPPEPAARSGAPGSVSWILMEYIRPGRASSRTEERLGRALSGVHAAAGSAAPPGGFGWIRDNWLGSLPQANGPDPSWPTFWRERRLAPQLRLARERGHLRDGVLDVVLDVSMAGLADVKRPELVHGDLWGGNWFAGPDGDPVLIDPAVYLGHGEVDLAMSELFGGFGARFYDAYREVHGITSAYQSYRRELYQLYYLLAHVNLFGASYQALALRAARRVAAALSA
jgi:fructosamine-3-kinase